MAEPAAAYNNMLFFSNALGQKENFLNNIDKTKNYTSQIAQDYENKYFKALSNGEGYNPMDALIKNFEAKGLDKTETKLYKKMVKYKKILEQKENNQQSKILKIGVAISCALSIIFVGAKYLKNKTKKAEN